MRPRSGAIRVGGFTLVELMVVVLVLAIAAGLAIPLAADTASTRLRSAARLLASDIGYARIESLAHGDDPRCVVFHPDGRGYHLAASSDNAIPLTHPVSHHPYRVTFGQGRARELEGIVIQQTNCGGDEQIGFGIYGELDQTDPATITLAADSQTLTLTVAPISGEVSIGTLQTP